MSVDKIKNLHYINAKNHSEFIILPTMTDKDSLSYRDLLQLVILNCLSGDVVLVLNNNSETLNPTFLSW